MARIFWVEDESLPTEKDDRGRSNNLVLDLGKVDEEDEEYWDEEDKIWSQYYSGFWDFCEQKWWIYELGDFVDFEVVDRWCDPTVEREEYA